MNLFVGKGHISNAHADDINEKINKDFRFRLCQENIVVVGEVCSGW